jgi:hypothetical protein
VTSTSEGPQTTSARPRFFPRQLVTADDLNQEQLYHREKLREHNRFLHGWGVVCGCDVQLVGGGRDTASHVLVCPGYVLTPAGDAIWIRSPATFDVATCFVQSEDPCALTRPCPPVTLRTIEKNTLYLAVRYAECTTQPVRVAPHGCSCDSAECEHSRIVDAYELGCLTTLPDSHKPVPRDCAQFLSDDRLVPCPVCPEDAWVVLATLKLESSRPVVLAGVDVFANRRTLPSVRRLQEMERCTTHGISAPWHARKGTKVYHDNLFCKVGSTITGTNFTPGTGKLRRCPECAKLDRWNEEAL